MAVVLRRGPSDWYRVIRWDLERDQFDDGAWFKGRIYEEKCDLSPDGALFLGFFHQGSRAGTPYTDSWTAVSRLPWLHAIGLWPAGTTYGGGGRFTGTRAVALRNGPDSQTHPDHPGHGLTLEGGPAQVHRSAEGVTGASWVGTDHRGRPIFAREGALYRGTGSDACAVRDLNPMAPKPQPAPDWARKPL